MNTPRTDAFISKFYGNRSLSSGSRHRTDVELHDFARQLERELAAAQAEIAELKEELADKRKFCYEIELALDGLKGDYIEIIKELRKECGK